MPNTSNLKKRLQKLKRQPGTIKMALLLVVFGVAGLVALQLGRAATPDTAAPGEPTEQILVQYKPSADVAGLRGKFNTVKAQEVDEIKGIRVKVLKVPKSQKAAALRDLAADPRVQFAEPDAIDHADVTTPNDPEYGVQWAWPNTKTDQLWDKTKGSSDVIVAVIDSGINFSHPEFAGKTVPGFDIGQNDNDPTDTDGHGSWVSGVVAPLSNNNLGVAGGCWECKIMPLKVFDALGNISAAATAKAMEYAADNGAKIITMSISGTGTNSTQEAAVDYATGKGVVMVSSAGNEGNGDPRRPSNNPKVIGVAGNEQDDTLAAGSSYGPHIDIAAPWTVRTTAHDSSGYTSVNGTSFSTPTVAGVLGLLLSAFPNATRDDLTKAVTTTADPCCDGKISGGRLNAQKAYDYLAANLPTPPPPPNPPTPPPNPPTPPPTPPTPTPKPGDLNNDGKVNITDLSSLLSAWGTAVGPADINKSGKVDIADLSILLSNWG